MQLWPPIQIFLVRTVKTFARIPVRMKKLSAFQIFIRWNVRLNKHNEIFANLPYHCRQEDEKLSQISKETKIQFFEQNCFFFIKYVSVAKENAFLRTLAKKVLQKPTDSQLRFQKPRKNLWIFRKENNFPPNVLTYM